jgi:hypothetical protein
MNVCGLSRLFCQRCREEMLHEKGPTCSRCGAVYVVQIPQNKAPPWVQALQGANERRARAHRKRLSIKP